MRFRGGGAGSITGTAEDWHGIVSRLNIVTLELPGPRRGGWVAGLPDDAFEHDGQLTKRDLRVVTGRDSSRARRAAAGSRTCR